MAAAASTRPPGATTADFLKIPAERRFHELIGGEIIQKSTPSFEHGAAQGQAFHLLSPYNRRPGGPSPGGWWFAVEVEIQLGADVYRPDVAGWRRERMPERPGGVPVLLQPDWICEVISPSNASNDTVKKMRTYHAAAVPHYWLLDPRDQTLAVYRYHPVAYLRVLSAERGERVRAEPFIDLELTVSAFFDADED